MAGSEGSVFFVHFWESRTGTEDVTADDSAGKQNSSLARFHFHRYTYSHTTLGCPEGHINYDNHKNYLCLPQPPSENSSASQPHLRLCMLCNKTEKRNSHKRGEYIRICEKFQQNWIETAACHILRFPYVPYFKISSIRFLCGLPFNSALDSLQKHINTIPFFPAFHWL